MVTEYPLACNNFAKDAEIIPFPSEEVTPPVTKIYLVGIIKIVHCRNWTLNLSGCKVKFFYSNCKMSCYLFFNTFIGVN